MPTARCNGIDIAYETDGAADGAPLLLIHGVGAQLIQWPPALLQALHAAGFRTIRFDNRDVGLSTHMDGAPVPDLAEVLAAKRRGEAPVLPYTLSTMAADTAALLDALGIGSAHVLGVSLGGMIAQTLAIEHRDRVRSLAIMMSQSGNPDLPPSNPEAIAALAKGPPDPVADPEAYLQHAISLNRAVGSTAYRQDEAALRQAAQATAARAYNPKGAARQLVAGRGGPDRRAALRTLDIPALVIHGIDDRLILPAAGEDLAQALPRAWLLLVHGMGHDLPAALAGLFAANIKANADRAAA